MPKAKPGDLPLDDVVQEHPLFPTMSDDEEPPIVAFITITRFDKGRQVWGPTMPASELQTIQDITNLYGGGDYCLMARRLSKKGDNSPGHTTKQKRIFLEGRPKPMNGSSGGDESDSPSAASSVVSSAPAVAMPQDGMVGLLMTMMAQQQQQAQQATAQAQQQSQNFMQMMIAMMGAGKTESSDMTKMMLQMSSQQSANMMQMMTVLMANRGGGPEEIAKYAQIIEALKGKGEGGEGGGDGGGGIAKMLEDAADVMSSLAALKAGGAIPAGVEPPAPGSAASVMGGGQ